VSIVSWWKNINEDPSFKTWAQIGGKFQNVSCKNKTGTDWIHQARERSGGY